MLKEDVSADRVTSPKEVGPAPPKQRARRPKLSLDDPAVSREQILAARLCDLDLRLEGSLVEPFIGRLHVELGSKGIRFQPRCYLSDEWGCPDGVPAIGIPFYLAHPRLREVERDELREIEGDDDEEMMQLLRHEAGHAINYAYRLHRRKGWQATFGRFSDPYPDHYKLSPYSKSFVRHLGHWYAQRHPDEDFAETFAVWLTPGLDWRKRYEGWGALRKLEYVDGVVPIAAASPPVLGTTAWAGSIGSIRSTLRTYNRRLRYECRHEFADAYDADLTEIFDGARAGRPDAAIFLRKRRREIVDRVAYWTGEKKIVVRSLVEELIDRAAELGLRVSPGAEERSLLQIVAYATTLTMNYAYTGSFLG